MGFLGDSSGPGLQSLCFLLDEVAARLCTPLLCFTTGPGTMEPASHRLELELLPFLSALRHYVTVLESDKEIRVRK